MPTLANAACLLAVLTFVWTAAAVHGVFDITCRALFDYSGAFSCAMFSAFVIPMLGAGTTVLLAGFALVAWMMKHGHG